MIKRPEEGLKSGSIQRQVGSALVFPSKKTKYITSTANLGLLSTD